MAVPIFPRRNWRALIVPVIAIVLSSWLLGIAIGGKLVPDKLPQAEWKSTFYIYAISVAFAAILVFAVMGLVYLRLASNRNRQLDYEILDAFMEHTPDHVFVKDRDGRFVRISRALAIYCGLSDPKQSLGKTDADIFTSEHANQALADEQAVMLSGQPMIAKEEKETWPDGRETWALTTKFPFKNSRGEIVGTMGISHNITDRKQAEMQASYLALHDALTDLPNRALLEDRLSQAIVLAVRNRNCLALFHLDLDGFTELNNSFGHKITDRLLQAVSTRLRSSLRESDTLARLGGDEFAIVVTSATDRDNLESIARKVLAEVAKPFEIDGLDLQITGSMGISRLPEDSGNVEELLRFSGAAMKEARKRGRGYYCFFAPEFAECALRQKVFERELQLACERDQFVIHYQPIYEARTRRITAVEALLRWRHPKLGLLPPGRFIPQLEELGLMGEVGRWVLKAACSQVVSWRLYGLPAVRIAVNISAEQFYRGGLAASIETILREVGLDPGALELELTESRILDDSAATLKIMHDLKKTGVSLSLDDFGTGWSSLSYVRRFPLDRLKIDQSFIRDIPSQPAAEAVVRSILSLGRDLGVTCVAEGVETAPQRDFLEREGCAEMQGYLFSYPLAAVDCSALLRSEKLREPAVFGSSINPKYSTAVKALPRVH